MSKVWEVGYSNKARKQREKLPEREKNLLLALVVDMENTGPVQYKWPNYSKLGVNAFHCHLSHKWVACWTIENDALKLIEIYYVGSRENAPYGN